MVNISFFDDLLDKYTINKSKKYSSQINIQKYAAMINITRQTYQGRKYKKINKVKRGEETITYSIPWKFIDWLAFLQLFLLFLLNPLKYMHTKIK